MFGEKPEGGATMIRVTAIGLDIAKSVFQVHGVDAAGQVVLRQRLARGRVLAFFEKLAPCLVGIEACGSSHYWARELTARGHEVRLMPAQYVKPYVKRSKNDAADAEAICEAVTRPTMRFVPAKTPEQQSVMMLHRVRLMLNRQRTQLSNSIRAHLSEFGIIAPIGRAASISFLASSQMREIRYAARHGTRRPWLVQLMQRRPAKVAAVALANKIARTIWALMTSGERYREPAATLQHRNRRESQAPLKLGRADRSECTQPVETAGSGK